MQIDSRYAHYILKKYLNIHLSLTDYNQNIGETEISPKKVKLIFNKIASTRQNLFVFLNFYVPKKFASLDTLSDKNNAMPFQSLVTQQ